MTSNCPGSLSWKMTVQKIFDRFSTFLITFDRFSKSLIVFDHFWSFSIFLIVFDFFEEFEVFSIVSDRLWSVWRSLDRFVNKRNCEKVYFLIVFGRCILEGFLKEVWIFLVFFLCFSWFFPWVLFMVFFRSPDWKY